MLMKKQQQWLESQYPIGRYVKLWCDGDVNNADAVDENGFPRDFEVVTTRVLEPEPLCDFDEYCGIKPSKKHRRSRHRHEESPVPHLPVHGHHTHVHHVPTIVAHPSSRRSARHAPSHTAQSLISQSAPAPPTLRSTGTTPGGNSATQNPCQFSGDSSHGHISYPSAPHPSGLGRVAESYGAPGTANPQDVAQYVTSTSPSPGNPPPPAPATAPTAGGMYLSGGNGGQNGGGGVAPGAAAAAALGGQGGYGGGVNRAPYAPSTYGQGGASSYAQSGAQTQYDPNAQYAGGAGVDPLAAASAGTGVDAYGGYPATSGAQYPSAAGGPSDYGASGQQWQQAAQYGGGAAGVPEGAGQQWGLGGQ